MEKRRQRIVFFLENILYYLLIVYVGLSLLGLGEEFLSMNIHPLLILVAIMSYRYGVYLGVVSATMATFSYLYVYMNLGKDIVLFFHGFEHYKFILMFYIISFALGRIRDNNKEKVEKLESEMSQVRKNYKKVYDNSNKLKYLNNRMKDEIIKSEESIIALHNIANNLDSLEIEELITNLIGIFKTYISAEKISIYSVDKHKKYMRLSVAVGYNRKLPDSIELSKYPEFLKVIESKKYSKREGQRLDIPIFSAPLLRDGEVIGILNIERLSYETYTVYTEKMFEILYLWTNKSITNASLYSEKISHELYYEGSKIMKEEHFDKLLKEQKKRKELFELSYILLKFEVLVEDIKKIVLKVRASDKACLRNDGKILEVLFPATTQDKKQILKSKILDSNKGILEEYYEG